MTKMTKNDKNDKIVKFIKKSQKLMSTKNNNLLTSRTLERHARGQKPTQNQLWFFKVFLSLSEVDSRPSSAKVQL